MKKSDSRLMFLEPPCFYCKHLTEEGTQEGLQGWTCPAFPNGIPMMILTRVDSHETVVEDQSSPITFESRDFPFEDGVHRITFDGDWYKP